MKIRYYTIIFLLTLIGCQSTEIGYLLTEHIQYDPDTLHVRANIKCDTLYHIWPNPRYYQLLSYGISPDEIKNIYREYPEKRGYHDDYVHYKYGTPWVSVPIQGVEGSQPVYFSIKKISSSEGDVKKFRAHLNIRGDGTFYVYPFEDDTVVPPGEYKISIVIENEHAQREFDDIFTVIVE